MHSQYQALKCALTTPSNGRRILLTEGKMRNHCGPQPLVYARLCLLMVFGSMSTQGGTLTIIHTFRSTQDGTVPVGVVMGPTGVLYGATGWGGVRGHQCNDYGGCGTVFSLKPPTTPGGAWTESIYTFPEELVGFNPAGITVGRGGAVLYGVTLGGGTCGGGIVFELSPPSPTSSWKESVLLNLCPNVNGLSTPSAPLVIGSGGVPYGPNLQGDGGIFSLTPPPVEGGAWTAGIVHAFSGTDGAEPNAVAIGEGGALYGTTTIDGNASPSLGTVYSLTSPSVHGGEWIETTLHTFTAEHGDGANPYPGVLIDSGGVLYGTTLDGGTGYCIGTSCGTVFSLIPPGPSGRGSYQVIHDFGGHSNGDGSVPLGGLAGLNGVLYGTTSKGGTEASFDCAGGDGGCGTIYSLTPPASPGGAWTETVLFNFTGGADGYYPVGTLAVDSNGVLYGVAQNGGEDGYGIVFSFKP
jgi:hypothetical protein